MDKFFLKYKIKFIYNQNYLSEFNYLSAIIGDLIIKLSD